MKLTKSMISWNGGIGSFDSVSKFSWTLTCHSRKIFPHHSAVQFAVNQSSVLANIRAKRAVAKAAQGRGHQAAPHDRASGAARSVSWSGFLSILLHIRMSINKYIVNPRYRTHEEWFFSTTHVWKECRIALNHQWSQLWVIASRPVHEAPHRSEEIKTSLMHAGVITIRPTYAEPDYLPVYEPCQHVLDDRVSYVCPEQRWPSIFKLALLKKTYQSTPSCGDA